MKSIFALLLAATIATVATIGTATASARSLRSIEYPEITPFPGNANSRLFCNYACSSKFYGGDMGWGESSPIKYEYPALTLETKKAMDVFYQTQKNDPVIKACGRPKKGEFKLYNACADVADDGEDGFSEIDSYVLQFGIIVPCDMGTIKKLQASGVEYPVVGGKFIVPVRAETGPSNGKDSTVKFAVPNPDFAPTSNPYKPEGGMPGFPKVQASAVCENCEGPTGKQCDRKATLEDTLCPNMTPGTKYLRVNGADSAPFGKISCVA